MADQRTLITMTSAGPVRMPPDCGNVSSTIRAPTDTITPREPSAGTREDILFSSDTQKSFSFDTQGVTGVKRKRNLREPSAGTPDKRIHLEPHIGARPFFDVSVRLPYGRRAIRIKALMDTGSTTFCLSDRFVNRYKIPRVQRDHLHEVRDAAGQILASGEAFTHNIFFRISRFVFKQPFEIIPMEPGHDMIIPDWWREQMGLSYRPDVGNPASWQVSFSKLVEVAQADVRRDSKGIVEEEPIEFSVEWDEAILVEKAEPIQIGAVVQTSGIPKMLPDGTWRPTSSLRVSISAITAEEILLRLPKRYHHFRKLFDGQIAKELPKHRPCDHAIEILPGTTPPWGPVYALSEVELQALREYLNIMLSTGKIRPSKSPAGAPILFIPKPHGWGLRLCVNYRGLNKITVKNWYLLPLMDEMRDRVYGSKIFTKIDLKAGYNLIRIKEGDEWKTAFRTRYGHFEYLVMPMGLTNAPATFQAFMNNILREFLDQGVIVYLDDILIYSRNEEEHEALVEKVLQRLVDNDLAAEIDKCAFHTREVDFLGYLLSPEGIAMTDETIRTIQEWESPKSAKDVQVFMGFANFYRRFIRNFSGICKPITDMLQGNPKDFVWSRTCERHFQFLKACFTTEPIL